MRETASATGRARPFLENRFREGPGTLIFWGKGGQSEGALHVYCARCGAQVGAQEISCPRCALDLRLSGAVRLTDPALDTAARGTLQEPARPPSAPRRGSPYRPPDEAVTRIRPAVGEDPDATHVMPIARSGRPSPGAERTEMLDSGRPGADDAPRVLNPRPAPAPGQGGPLHSSRAVPRPRVRAEGSLPSEWFRDPQAEYTRAVGASDGTPPPVFTPPPMPQSPSEPPKAEHEVESGGRRLMPLVVAVMVITLAILIGVVLWLLSDFTAKADGVVPQGWPGGVAAAPPVGGGRA